MPDGSYPSSRGSHFRLGWPSCQPQQLDLSALQQLRNEYDNACWQDRLGPSRLATTADLVVIEGMHDDRWASTRLPGHVHVRKS
jgi:hypothetical protein